MTPYQITPTIGTDNAKMMNEANAPLHFAPFNEIPTIFIGSFRCSAYSRKTHWRMLYRCNSLHVSLTYSIESATLDCASFDNFLMCFPKMIANNDNNWHQTKALISQLN